MEINIAESSTYIKENCWEIFSKYVSNYEKVFFIIDEKILNLYHEDVNKIRSYKKNTVFTITKPEGQKEFSTIEQLATKATEFGLNRQDAVLAIGGGATLDIAGFFCSIYKRGIDYFSFPTTLLSQIDSAIGGKTGVNFNGVKNVFGSFYDPKGIFIDSKYIETLSNEDYYGGLGEVWKYALLDKELFEDITKGALKILSRDNSQLYKVIEKCIVIKKHYIEADYFDNAGVRIALNLGHTLGHLIENKEPYFLNHGYAVAYGLKFALYISLSLSYISKEEYLIRKKFLSLLFSFIPEINLKELNTYITYLNTDKKFSKGKIQFVVPTTDGYSIINLLPQEFSQGYLDFQELI
ncbi:3-dehydroquinate synthase [Alkalicella caledoniensis]|uniref:3-dehydroquinate synthase n=1 Tax=Alkalicella caledoniensis TaxID=2731377 RepID=A0A7G9WCB5_ALKCA|nr:3-dehydroquinate synthase family protein [Alkalicella caledoniensis]QNO16327.1 3-dehydroquinate synthase [Alkalicella caledoniensis]